MRRGIATVSVSGSLVDKLTAIADAGFDGVEIFDQDLTCSPVPAAGIAARCADLGLSIDLFQPLRDLVGMRPEVFADRLRFARAKFAVMARLGTDRALACSAVHPLAVDDADLLAEQLAVLGDLAAEHGVTVAFEALAWGSYVNRFADAWAAVQRAGRPNVGVAVDTFHLLARGDDASALAGIPGERIAFLQIADAPLLGMDVLQWSRHHRCFPGQGSLDVVGVVAAVLEAGYRGPLSLEVFSDIVREAPAEDTARDAMRSLRYLEEQLAAHWASPALEGIVSRPPVELFEAPPAPRAPEAAYVQIATRRGDDVGVRLLETLGLRAEGQDPVTGGTWWCTGGATVLLTEQTDAGHPTQACALGIAVDDPAGVAARAHALGWPVLPRPGGVGALGVSSPTGVVVALHERLPELGRPQLDESAPRWLGIDHVGAAVDADRSDAEVSFYRTLVGLRPGPVSEFADPLGRLRSRLLLPAQGGLRVVLNIVVRSGPAAPVGINQVAFRCVGLLDLVERLRACGAPLLDVPGAYYDDLQARFDVPADLAARIRDLGVLYDREGEGDLLHVYTPMIGGRFFVELLERRGGYAGYGSANTPVRLALQAAARNP